MATRKSRWFVRGRVAESNERWGEALACYTIYLRLPIEFDWFDRIIARERINALQVVDGETLTMKVAHLTKMVEELAVRVDSFTNNAVERPRKASRDYVPLCSMR